MRYVGISIAVILVITGAVLVTMMQLEQQRERALREYIFSRGAAPIPPQLRGRIGEGI